MAQYALEKLKEIGKGYLRICRRGKYLMSQGGSHNGYI